MLGHVAQDRSVISPGAALARRRAAPRHNWMERNAFGGVWRHHHQAHLLGAWTNLKTDARRKLKPTARIALTSCQ
jgi:hypothetical protein